MKFATRHNGSRDGELLIVSRDNTRAIVARDVAPTMQALLDDWAERAPRARDAFEALEAGARPDAFELDVADLHSPLPRAYAWVDGSAFIHHIVLVRKARGAEPPPTLRTEPLVYQGGSDAFLDPRGDIPVRDLAWGPDFEAEIAVILDDVPQGVPAAEAEQFIRLVTLCNDVTLRALVPGELAKGFGFFQSKPSSTFGPLAITLDELGDAWRDARVHLPLVTRLNGEKFGDPEAGAMHFSFADLIAHCARTRPLRAGTLLGSGTVSNEDRRRGSSCLAERRMLEIIDTGEAHTPWLGYGDVVRIEMFDPTGHSLFGAIEQRVVPIE